MTVEAPVTLQEEVELESGCVWPVLWGCGEQCEHFVGLTPVVQEAVMGMAVDRLRTWTSYGLCPRAVRPCRSGCSSRHDVCGCNSHMCSCDELEELRLPGPVGAINQVRVNGMVLDPQAYVVWNWKWLGRIDGGSWPTCQDIAAPPTELDTFEVDYMRGLPVPYGGRVALGALVCQMSRAVCGEKCDLPMKASSVSRQGVSMTFDLEAGETGIFLIDDWVQSVNRGGGFVLTPEKYYRQAREVTWQAA